MPKMCSFRFPPSTSCLNTASIKDAQKETLTMPYNKISFLFVDKNIDDCGNIIYIYPSHNILLLVRIAQCH